MSMSQALLAKNPAGVAPDVSHLITEDDTPVDSFFCESAMRCLTEPLHSSWSGPPAPPGAPPRPFIASANVGIYETPDVEAIVPDVLLSADVRKPVNLMEKSNRVYFLWRIGKAPDIVIEIVSNREGGELSDKLRRYEKMRVTYYAVFDPECHLSHEPLHVFELRGGALIETPERTFPRLGLGLTLWVGAYEGVTDTWLRWTDADGRLIPTGAERAADAEAKAAGAEAKAAGAEAAVEAARSRAAAAEAREARLREKLRALGLDEEG